MRLLIDTHLLLWVAQKSSRLSSKTLTLIGDPDNELIFSVASLWEYAIKYTKFPADFTVSPTELREALIQNGYSELDISAKHVLATASLPPMHGDPFDRILLAQSAVEGIMLVTSDERVSQYPGSIRKV